MTETVRIPQVRALGNMISADPKSPFYHPDAVRAHVVCNGYELKDVIAADPVEGIFLQCVRDSNGHLVIDQNNEVLSQWIRQPISIRYDPK